PVLHNAWIQVNRRTIVFLLIACCAWAQPSESDRAFAHAVQLHRNGDLEGAVREYRAVLSSDPNRIDARSNLGAVLAKLGRYEEAIEEYRQALNTNPSEAH